MWPNFARLVVLGPSQVDVSLALNDSQFGRVRALGLSRGNWVDLRDYEKVVQVAGAISGMKVNSRRILENLKTIQGLSIEAGSSTLGMLCAMRKNVRDRADFLCVLASTNGEIDPISSFFMAELKSEGISSITRLCEGSPPIGFVLSRKNDSERILASHAGVASMDPPLILGEQICLVIDAYELRSPGVLSWLRSMRDSIRSICLSLGSEVLLEGPVGYCIRTMLSAGQITAIAGNILEYKKLFHDVPSDIYRIREFGHHPIHDAVPYSLLTDGPNGMIANWNGVIFGVQAKFVETELIVNTSGAGDSAAGRFFSGAIANEDPIEVLEDAANLGSQVLRTHSSRLNVGHR